MNYELGESAKEGERQRKTQKEGEPNSQPEMSGRSDKDETNVNLRKGSLLINDSSQNGETDLQNYTLAKKREVN